MTKNTRNILIKGSKDPADPNRVLVKISDARRGIFPWVNPEMVPPNTFFRFNTMTRKPESLVSTVKEMVIAWDMCGECSSYFTSCKCTKGLCAPRYLMKWLKEGVVDNTASEEALKWIEEQRELVKLRQQQVKRLKKPKRLHRPRPMLTRKGRLSRQEITDLAQIDRIARSVTANMVGGTLKRLRER